ncbi:hypothetical protein GIB67_009326 [Kingdonia uniflora]|uniref:Uncharacterized protein n=1 Tax=Kingdonia uniflora TaxID=39325 RepID=A0A7J7N2V4_9MAGN|nr:hypothetical protein GIB67_009326 [Kingdonia uniflora]
MFRFFCKEILIRQTSSRVSTIRPHCCYLQTQSLKPKSESVKDEKSLFTVPYLINSCGLSLQSADSASKKINIKSTKNADSVLELFRVHGFTDSQITKLVTVV